MKIIEFDPEFCGICLASDDELSFEYATFWKSGLNILSQYGIAATCYIVIM